MLQWQSQEAKARFSELMRQAQHDPQVITVRGKEEAVLMSKSYYDQLMQHKPSLVAMMQQSPLYGEELMVDRDDSLPRDIEL